MSRNELHHYRVMKLLSPFTLSGLESFCAMLRAQGQTGTLPISHSGNELMARVTEPIDGIT